MSVISGLEFMLGRSHNSSQDLIAAAEAVSFVAQQNLQDSQVLAGYPHAQSKHAVSIVLVIGLTTLSALATGLTALPFLCYKNPNVSRFNVGVSNAAASGLMLSAVLGLTWEGILRSSFATAIGSVAGFVLMVFSKRVLEKYEDLSLWEMQAFDTRKVLLLMGVMTLHSLAEGVGMGMSFGGDEVLGVCVSIVMSVHNIPEGLAIVLVLLPRGVSAWKAGLCAIFSSLPQPIMAVPAFLFVEQFEAALPYGLGFASGAMVFIIFLELVPDSIKDAPMLKVIFTMGLSMVCMTIFQYLFVFLAQVDKA